MTTEGNLKPNTPHGGGNNSPKMRSNNHLNTPRDGGKNSPRTPRDFKQKSVSKTNIPKQEEKKEKKKKEGCPEMASTVGMVGRKFVIDELEKQKYQPWDCVSITEDKIASFAKNAEKKKLVISYTRNSFMKVYPRGTRFDSSNCDPTKSWLCGAQISALNLQSTDDDYVLLNKIFFKLNGGCGYILKPDWLIDEKAPIKSYKSHSMNLLIKIISGNMLQNILKIDGVYENIKEIAVSVQLLGSYEDDNNEIYYTEYINQNFVNPIFNNAIVNFKVYESDLSFVIIKIFSGKTILARAILPLWFLDEGIKLVSLFDNKCKEIENSVLVLKISKTNFSSKID